MYWQIGSGDESGVIGPAFLLRSDRPRVLNAFVSCLFDEGRPFQEAHYYACAQTMERLLFRTDGGVDTGEIPASVDRGAVARFA